MSNTGAATTPSGGSRPARRGGERMSLSRLRDRLKEAEAEWHDVVERLGQQRSTLRALARSIDKATAQLAHANRSLSPAAAPDAVAAIQRQLDADQLAYDRALRSHERSLATADHARVRLHREMSRLREEIRALEPRRPT